MKAMAGVIVALVIAVSATGWMLKRAWQHNTRLEDNARQYQQTIDDQNRRYRKLIAEKARNEKELTANAEAKHQHQEVIEKIRYVTRTIQKQAPATDCINQPAPAPLLECLRDADCGQAGSPGAGVPAGAADPPDG